MAAVLAEILKDPRIWRGNSFNSSRQATCRTGFDALDEELPGGGWPLASISEIVSPRCGDGVMSLLQPILSRISQEALPSQTQQTILIAPPFIPYPPALAAKKIDPQRLSWIIPSDEQEKLWAFEQSLREPACAAVLAWHEGQLPDRLCRRLQLAIEAGGGLGFLVRINTHAAIQSPFALRLQVSPDDNGLQINILKRRGAPLRTPIFIPTHTQDSHAVFSPSSTAPGARRVSTKPIFHAVG